MKDRKELQRKLITIREAAKVLNIPEYKVIQLINADKIRSYTIGGEYVRLKREELEVMKSTIKEELQISSESKTFKEKTSDFLYFNDFYILSFIVVVGLLFLIFTY